MPNAPYELPWRWHAGGSFGSGVGFFVPARLSGADELRWEGGKGEDSEAAAPASLPLGLGLLSGGYTDRRRRWRWPRDRRTSVLDLLDPVLLVLTELPVLVLVRFERLDDLVGMLLKLLDCWMRVCVLDHLALYLLVVFVDKLAEVEELLVPMVGCGVREHAVGGALDPEILAEHAEELKGDWEEMAVLGVLSAEVTGGNGVAVDQDHGFG